MFANEASSKKTTPLPSEDWVYKRTIFAPHVPTGARPWTVISIFVPVAVPDESVTAELNSPPGSVSPASSTYTSCTLAEQPAAKAVCTRP